MMTFVRPLNPKPPNSNQLTRFWNLNSV